jgi:3-oxoadipate enol-lactonase
LIINKSIPDLATANPTTNLMIKKPEYAIHGPDTGQWITLSHPIGSDLNIWAGQISDFSRRHRVLVYTTRGHGSDDRNEFSCTVSDLAEDVLQIWDQLGIDRSHFVGLSLGGCTGVALACQAPGRVRSLVVVNSRLEMDETSANAWSKRAESVESQGMQAVAGGMLERWLTPAFLMTHPVEVASVKQALLATSPKGFAACARALASLHLEKNLSALVVPTLFIAGLADNAVPSPITRQYAACNSGFSFAEIPGPHILNLENPAGFNQNVLDFIDRSQEASFVACGEGMP